MRSDTAGNEAKGLRAEYTRDITNKTMDKEERSIRKEHQYNKDLAEYHDRLREIYTTRGLDDAIWYMMKNARF